MTRSLLGLIAASFLLVNTASALEVQATIRRIEAGQGLVQFHAMQQDRSAKVAPDARFLDEEGNTLAGGFESEALKPGAEVTLTVERVENRPVIRAIRLGKNSAGGAQPAEARPSGFTPVDTSNLTALTDLRDGKYQGFEGGLYPGGANARPESHEAAGLALAREITPRDAEGDPSPEGKIVLLGIGFSNTVQAFNGFMKVARDDPSINPRVLLVNGAVGGMSAEMVQQADSGRGKQYWDTVDERLKAAAVTRAQVQVVWIKETNPQGGQPAFPGNAQALQAQIGHIVRIVHERFPNVRLAYLSSRTYGGWALPKPGGGGPGNSEPYSYETGFAVKWLIERQLEGDASLNYEASRGPVKAPWLSWGPYLWANGMTPRSDGFRFALDDFMANDQMHESPTGQVKIGRQLVQFFKDDPTTRPWFVVDRPE